VGEVSRYPDGTFCWIDLGTPDVPRARAFYGELFGWGFDEAPAGGYLMCRLDRKDVTGIHEHPPEERANWSSYVSVGEVEVAAARAADLGGTVTLGPIEVGDTARMSVIRDPAGAEVCLWQAKGFIGAGLVNEVGTWTWNELTTPDVEAAKAFYGALFGWEAQDVPVPIPRAGFSLEGLLVGGVHAPAEGKPDRPRWTVSFRVADVDRTADQVRRQGGTVLLPPTDIPIGRFSVVADPAGAAFTVSAFSRPVQGVDGS
jgi:predicted enzyme related to lactoylglutathione lyase